MALIVGLTGGIGAGKSLCARIFKLLDVPVYSADDEAKNLMTYNPVLRASLIDIFGPNTYQSDGSLNRPYLASTIFNDKTLLKKMNQLVHPEVGKHFLNWCNEHKDAPYIMQENAILFQSGLQKNFDKIIFVDAPEKLRIQRAAMRDGVNADKIIERIKNQLPVQDQRDQSDYIIENDGIRSLVIQVLMIHRALIDHSASLGS